MKPVEFTPVGVIHIAIAGGDLVVRGQAESSSARLLAAKMGDIDAAQVVSVQEGATYIEVSGDMTLTVPEDASVIVSGTPGDVVLRKIRDAQLEGCSGDLVVSDLVGTADQSPLRVLGAVHGDVAIRKTESAELQTVHRDMAVAHVGKLKIEHVHGDISLAHVDEVNLDSVDRDMTVTHVKDFQVKNVAGDVALNSVTGSVTIHRLGGDLSIVSPGETLTAPDVVGDVSLRGPLQPGGRYWINAGGDVAARIAGDVRVFVRAEGEVMVGAEIQFEVDEEGIVKGQLGLVMDNAAELSIDAQGDVILNSPQEWQRHHSATVDAELRQAMAEVQSELRQTAVTVKSELQQAGNDVAQELEQSGIRDIVRDLLKSLKPETSASSSPSPSTQPTVPDADELKLVLNMLERGAITVDEAERLIEALNR